MAHREFVVAAVVVVAVTPLVAGLLVAGPIVAAALSAPFVVLILAFPLLSPPVDCLWPCPRLVLAPAKFPHH